MRAFSKQNLTLTCALLCRLRVFHWRPLNPRGAWQHGYRTPRCLNPCRGDQLDVHWVGAIFTDDRICVVLLRGPPDGMQRVHSVLQFYVYGGNNTDYKAYCICVYMDVAKDTNSTIPARVSRAPFGERGLLPLIYHTVFTVKLISRGFDFIMRPSRDTFIDSLYMYM